MLYAGFRVVPAPGQGIALVQDVGRVNKIVGKHGGKAVANFTVTVGDGIGNIVYLFGYKDWATFGASGPALQADAEWQKLLAERGAQIAAINNTVFTPTPDSPMQ